MLTLPKARTITVDASNSVDGSNLGTIELTTKVGTMIPTLQVPSILQLIRNTSGTAAQNLKQNSRYTAEVKADEEVLVSKSDGENGTFTTDPRSLPADDLEYIVAQITPEMKGKKYKNIEWDEKTEGAQDLLARKMSSFISVRRVRKSFEAVAQIRLAAIDTQSKLVAADPTAITFETGSHTQELTLGTGKPSEKAEIAYELFVNATSNFRRIGTKTAISTWNKQYSHAEGIAPEDMFVIMSPEFEAAILAMDGVFASSPGNALFQQAGIKNILGYLCASNIALPADVHFIIVTTGMNGTYGYETVDGGEKGNLITDPDWSFGKRLDLKDTYSRGVVLPFQIFMATKPNAVAPIDPDAPAKQVIAGKEVVGVDLDGDGLDDKIVLFDPVTYYGLVGELTAGQRAALKVFFKLPLNTSNADLQIALDTDRKPV